MVTAIPAFAATEEEIEDSISKGLMWLNGTQNIDGSWGNWDRVARTGLAVLKFETRAVELGQDPLDPSYEYYYTVRRGLDFIFSKASSLNITVQPAGNPDTNGNGIGLAIAEQQWHRSYETGISLMAIGASTHPEMTVNVNGSAVDGWTYAQVVQDAVDYLSFGQNDANWPRGAWGYYENYASWSDNSNSGWVVLGLGYAEAFGATIPQFLKTELNIWINYVQDPVDGDPNDGGSGYTGPGSWVNMLKTGNLLYQMAFVGDTLQTQRVIDAIDYQERHWNDTNWDPGWKGPYYGNQWPHYQAAYAIMKGFEVFGIQTISLPNGTDVDWFDEMSTAIVTTQNANGSWPYDYWGDSMLATVWALLTLEKAIPSRVVVYVDKYFTDTEGQPIQNNTIYVVMSEDGDVKSTNPGGVLAWIKINNTGLVSINSTTIFDTLPSEWGIDPPWDPARSGVKVYFYSNATGDEIEIEWKLYSVTPHISAGTVSIGIPDIPGAVGKSMDPGDVLTIRLKLRSTLKGGEVDPNSFPRDSVNTVEVDAFEHPYYGGGLGSGEASATLTLVAKIVGQGGKKEK